MERRKILNDYEYRCMEQSFPYHTFYLISIIDFNRNEYYQIPGDFYIINITKYKNEHITKRTKPYIEQECKK